MIGSFEKISQIFFKNHEFGRIKALLGFDEQTEFHLITLKPLVESHICELIDGFYRYVTQDIEILSYFQNPQHIERMKQINTQSFVDCFTPPFNEDHFRKRLKVGFVHSQIKLKPVLYFGAIKEFHQLLLNLIDQQQIEQSVKKSQKEAVNRMINCEIFLTIESYFLSKEDRLQEAHSQTKEILDHLSEGFFTVNEDGSIGPQYSHSCERIFGKPIGLLAIENILPIEQEKKIFFRAAIDQFFENFMPIEVNLGMIPKLLESKDNRILEFHYQPILNDRLMPAKLIVTVKDTTETKKREKELTNEARLNKILVNMIRDRESFTNFLEDTKHDLRILKEGCQVEIGMRILHTIKGNAGAFDWFLIADLAHLWEDRLAQYTTQNTLEETQAFFREAAQSIDEAMNQFLSDHLPSLGFNLGLPNSKTFQMNQLEFNFLEAICQNIADPALKLQLHGFLSHVKRTPVSTMTSVFAATIERLAHRLGKQIRYEETGTQTRIDPKWCRDICKNMIHAIRNACDHGIEPPEERQQFGKDPTATIRFQAEIKDRALVLTLSDNGRGIDREKLLEKAVEKNLILQNEIGSLRDQDILMLIFADGVSTASRVTNVSGRGVGMAALKKSVDEKNGLIDIESAPVKGTIIRITIPFDQRHLRNDWEEVS